MTKEEVVDEIINKHKEYDVLMSINLGMLNFVDDDWASEYDDIYEAYEDSSCYGDAEAMVLSNLIYPYREHLIGINAYMYVWNALCDTWQIELDEKVS